MYLSKKVSLGILLSALSVSSVFAEDASYGTFQGFDLGLGMAVQDFNYGGGSQTSGGPFPENFSGTNKTDINAVFDLGYNIAIPALTNNFLLGLQASWQPIHSSTATTQKDPGTITQERVKNRYGVAVLPGWMLNMDNMVYGKVGYSHASRDMNNENDAWSTTLNYNGYVLGAGVKSLELANLTGLNNLYMFAEYDYSHYNSQAYNVVNTEGYTVISTPLKLSANELILGIGYSF